MLNIRKSIISVAALSVLFMTSCTEREVTVRGGDTDLKFRVGVACSEVSGAVKSQGGTPATKGTLINDSGSQKNLESIVDDGGLPLVGTFKVASWNSDGSVFIADGTDVTYSKTDGKWSTAQSYSWPTPDVKTFYAYANLPTGMSVTNAQGYQTFACTAIGATASAQKDALLGYYSGDGTTTSSGTGVASIDFVHPLTSVIFRKGEFDEGVTVKSISIKNVYKSGTAKVTYSYSGGVATPTYDWKNGGATDTRSEMCEVSQSGEPLSYNGLIAFEGEDPAPSADNVIGEPFIILPQAIPASTSDTPITLHFVFTDSLAAEYEFDYVITGAEGATAIEAWQSGSAYVYTVNYKGGVVEVTVEEEFDQQVKKDVCAENTGSIDTYMRMTIVANWVDSDGNIVESCDWMGKAGSRAGLEGFALDESEPKWALLSDGFFYYKNAIKKSEVLGSGKIRCYTTGNLFTSYTPPTPPRAGLDLEMVVIAQSVEFDKSKKAIGESWGSEAADYVSDTVESSQYIDHDPEGEETE